MTEKKISTDKFPISEPEYETWLERTKKHIEEPGSMYELRTRQEAREGETPIKTGDHNPRPGLPVLELIREAVDDAIRIAEDISQDPKLNDKAKNYPESLKIFYNLLHDAITNRRAEDAIRWSFQLGQLVNDLPVQYWGGCAHSHIVQSKKVNKVNQKLERGRIPDIELQKMYDSRRKENPGELVKVTYAELAEKVQQIESEAGRCRDRTVTTPGAIKQRLQRFQKKSKIQR